MLVSILYKELEKKIQLQKLKYKKLEVMQARIKNKPNFENVNEPSLIAVQNNELLQL